MIHNSDGMSKKCNSKSLFFFFFSPGFAPYFRMSDLRMLIDLLYMLYICIVFVRRICDLIMFVFVSGDSPVTL